MTRKALLLAALLSVGCDDTGDVCNSGTTSIGDLCLPRSVAPSITTTIQLRELCGRGCSEIPNCTAVFRDSQVILDVEQTVCNSQLGATCLDLGCMTRTIPCALPSLPAGDYALLVPGGAIEPLHVAAGGESSCRLPALDGGVQ